LGVDRQFYHPTERGEERELAFRYNEIRNKLKPPSERPGSAMESNP
jgi:hypothetical protein